MEIIGATATAFLVIYTYNTIITNLEAKEKDIIRYLSPAVEEVAKTFISVYFAVPVLSVHVSIGVIEGIQDYYISRTFPSSIFSVVGHVMFGYITQIVARLSGYLILGVLAAWLIHVTWNSLVMKLARS